MRAVGVTRAGGPDVLAVVEVPLPVPRPGQVRIRVHAAGVNPADFGIRELGDRGIMSGPPPWVPGMDAAGTVDLVGEGVSRLAAGDRVMAIVSPFGTRTGAQAEYVIVPEDSAVVIPDGLSMARAATLPMNGLTATVALRHLALEPGDVLAVTGGAGYLASYAIPLAKERGLEVVADAAPSEAELVRSYGADRVVERGPGLADRLREAYPDGVAAVLDAASVGGGILPAIRSGGEVLVVTMWQDGTERDIRITPLRVGEYAKDREGLESVADAARRGVLVPRIVGDVGPEAVGDAHRAMAARGVRGRYVVRFAEGD